MRYLTPTTDFGFKHIFSHKTILIGFLNAVLPAKDTVVDLEYASQEELGGNPEGRVVIFDLHCTTDDGRTVIVEMQRLPQPYFKRRILFYAMRGFEHHMRRGISEYDFAPVYVVSVVDFTLPGDYQHYFSKFMLKNDDGELFSDVLQLMFVELPKFDMTKLADKEELTPLEQWTAALKTMPALDGVPDWVTEEDIERAFTVSELSTLSPAERSKFERALRDDMDLRGQVLQQYIYGKMSGMKEGKVEGKAEGKAEGKEENMAQTVSTLHAKGYTVPQIADMLDLTEEQVEHYLALYKSLDL